MYIKSFVWAQAHPLIGLRGGFSMQSRGIYSFVQVKVTSYTIKERLHGVHFRMGGLILTIEQKKTIEERKEENDWDIYFLHGPMV